MHEIVITLLSGLNIVQLFSYNQLKRKIKAESDQATLDVISAECALKKDNYDYLISKLQYFQEEHYKLLDTVNKEGERNLRKVEELNNELLTIRNQVNKYKLESCKRIACQQRIQ